MTIWLFLLMIGSNLFYYPATCVAVKSAYSQREPLCLSYSTPDIERAMNELNFASVKQRKLGYDVLKRDGGRCVATLKGYAIHAAHIVRPVLLSGDGFEVRQVIVFILS
ncbi:hypothetical protein OBBRIDRAFT_227463 [Obba rivulosa]|uniref:Uncharacterized protein n=1 Tax=Obba rivulosa TaxID=1052685 RepID=A0A8E2AW23_9APHY|nr:hypothetical protein OBBRIDRAFT_227463 [Obba rivulosa]